MSSFNIKKSVSYIIRVSFFAILFSFSASLYTHLYAQPTYNGGDLTIDGDGDVPGNAAAITRIDGHLTIGGALTSFPNFAVLEAVEGNLRISGITDNSLTTLSDIFPALDSVYGNLAVQSNDFIETITGFAQLDTIGGALHIGGELADEGNPVLEMVGALNALKKVERGIFIQNNAALVRLFSSLPVLRLIVGSLVITNNDALVSLPEFPSLEVIRFYVDEDGSNVLANLIISDNDKLASITQTVFPVLTDVGGRVEITDNADLSNCSGLHDFVTGFIDFLGVPDIRDNAAGCNNTTDVLTYTEGNLRITDVSNIPANVEEITRITGFLHISELDAFPNFAALKTINGDVEITELRNVEELVEIFPVLGTVEGSITISRVRGGGVTNIFPSLQMLGGNIVLGPVHASADIQEIFPVLETLDGSIQIDEFISETNIFDIFPALEVVTGDITLRASIANVGVQGIFPALDSVRGSLIFQGLPSLGRYSGFVDLDSIGGNLQLGEALPGVPAPSPEGNTADLPPMTNLRIVGGSVLINSNRSPSLPSLPAMERIGGDLIISDNRLPLIPAWDALKSIGGNLSVIQNPELFRMSNFASLTDVGGDLTVTNNPRLSECCGLLDLVNGVNTVGVNTFVSGNASVTCGSADNIIATCQLDDLEIMSNADIPDNIATLRRIRGDLTIGGDISDVRGPDANPLRFRALIIVEGNIQISNFSNTTDNFLRDIFPTLLDVEGDLTIGGDTPSKGNPDINGIIDFQVLRSVGGSLTVQNNAKLSVVLSFDALQSVGGLRGLRGDLTVSNNAILEIFPSFPILTDIGGDLDISTNAKLVTLASFSSLATIGGDLTLSSNTTLSSCCRLQDFVVGSTTISGNATGCNSLTEIMNACFAGDLAILDNSDIPLNVATITNISGNLTISGALSSFPSFNALNFVGGNVEIKDLTTPVDLSGSGIFPALTHVGDSLMISGNSQTTISGFGALLRVGDNPLTDATGGLFISSNNALTSVPDFANLNIVGGPISIRDNSNIPSLPTFANLIATAGVIVSNNARLATISGFNTILQCGGEFSIMKNPVLTEISTFKTLLGIGEGLRIEDNDMLTAISTFMSVFAIGGRLTITDNAALKTISGFNNLFNVGGIMISNPALTTVGDFGESTGNVGLFVSTGDISFVDNPELTGIPSFPALAQIGDQVSNVLVVRNNPLVETTPEFPKLALGGVHVEDMPKLTTIGEFPLLNSSLRSAIIIRDNPKLTVFPRFPELVVVVDADIRIENNDALQTVPGFKNLTSTSVISITDNAVLTSFGFNELNAVDSINIVGNPKLLEIIGTSFGNLQNAGPIRITDNDELMEVFSFEKLQYARGLVIRDNKVLEGIPEFSLFAASSILSPIGANIPSDLDIVIMNNPMLSEVNGFEELVTVGDIVIENNAILETLPSFTKLSEIVNLRVENNPLLTLFPEFADIQEIYESFVVRSNASLETLTTLTSTASAETTLRVATIDIEISNNAKLTSFEGLPDIEFIWSLNISGNDKLTSLPDFPELTIIDNDLVISDNAELTALPAFPLLEVIDGVLTIEDNAKLSSCCGIFVFKDKASTTISGNATGCSVAEITTDCRMLTPEHTEITVPAGRGRFFLSVASNLPWKITKNPVDAWVQSVVPPSVESGRNHVIEISYVRNTTSSERKAVLMLDATDAAATESVDITLTQEALRFSADMTALNVGAERGSVTLNVSANVPWQLTETTDWIIIVGDNRGIDDKAIIISYAGNILETSREATLTFEETGAGATESVDIILTQEAARELSATSLSLTVAAEAGRTDLNIEANVPWALSESVDWITSLSHTSGSADKMVAITYVDNPLTTERKATLTLSATDAGATESVEIILTQEGRSILGVPTGASNLGKGLHFFPNPASTTLFVSGITQETALTLHTFSGKVALHTRLRQDRSIDLRALPQGTYLLTLQNAQERITTPFIHRN